MQLINYIYQNAERLEAFISTSIDPESTILVQIFSGLVEREKISEVQQCIISKLPHASVIGATTAGEIADGHMSSGQIVLAFAIFEATEIRTYYFPKSDYAHGVEAARRVVTPRTKVCIAFSEGLQSDSEAFLQGFASVAPQTKLAGGNAGDALTFTKTLIMHESAVYEEGLVLAALESDRLSVHNEYSLNWTPIGKEMRITKANGNIVHEIDGMAVKSLYTHYLGAETVSQIPASAIAFPLVKMEDGTLVARSLIAQLEDGGFVYAGHFLEGDTVRFAIGNVEEILNRAPELSHQIAQSPTEATFVYSCSVRKLFLQQQLEYELGLIEQIAPTAGFFTYGEFYHASASNQLLNITTTTLSLSESLDQNNSVTFVAPPSQPDSLMKSLTHLVNVTQHELNENIAFLNQYKEVLDKSAIVSKTDLDGNITYVNEAFCRVSGYSRDELLGSKHNIVRHPDSPDSMFKELWATITAGKTWRQTFKNRKKDGGDYYLKSVIMPIFDDSGAIVEYIASRTDVTELILKEQLIQRQRTDRLTGVKSREAFFEDIETSRKMTLMLFDLDRFSEINDYFGYDIGDRLLKKFAQILQENLPDDEIYRISADEFAVLSSQKHFDAAFKASIINFSNRLESLKCDLENYHISLNISCGVAHARSDEIYRFSHIALKEAKETQKKVVFFNDDHSLRDKTKNNVIMINKIKSAIEKDRIIPYFQGIVDNRTREIVKYESLIRLIDEDGTVLSPFWFLEHAKKSRLYDRLTQIMIRKTFERFEKLPYDFSINLSIQDIISEQTRTLMLRTIATSPAAPRLVVEIVESEGIENFEEVTHFIQELKAYGCKIAIDDFGTGYSNFNYLSRLDVDYIKIDGSLITNINTDETHLITLQSILLFANRKGIKTIAEFVENDAIYQKLCELGVDFSQGFLFSKPAPDISR